MKKQCMNSLHDQNGKLIKMIIKQERLMNESKKSLKTQKETILQKDLSFSNQIFKKSLYPEALKSNKSSSSNFHHSHIPALVKYNGQTTHDLNHIHSASSKQDNQKYVNLGLSNSANRQNTIGYNLKQEGHNFVDKKSIPPLSKVEEMIFKKYKRMEEQEKSFDKHGEQDVNNRLSPYKTKVYFDKTENLEKDKNHLRYSGQDIVNIDSLQQSRIANESIQKHNNWVLGNVDDSEFIDQIKANQTGQKKALNLNNQSFRNINPLNLVANSLHTSFLPQFIEDDSMSQNDEKFNESRAIHSEIFPQRDGLKINKNQDGGFSRRRQTNRIQKNMPEDEKKRKQKPIKQITMSLFDYYFGDHGQDGMIQSREDAIDPNLSIERQQKSSIDNLTNRSSPILNRKQRTEMIDYQKSISQTNNFSRSIDMSIESYSQRKPQINFIHDKTAQEMIVSLFNDEKKAKLFLKYLQIEISDQPQNTSLCHHYELLSCLLDKIQSISEKNIQSKTPSSIAQSILQLYTPKKEQNPRAQKVASCKPQIIRNNKQIRIDFDPFLKYQKNLMNEKISALKKSLDEKNKETELVKLTYDGIVHNYAVTLQNLAKKSQTTQNPIQPSPQDSQQQKLTKEMAKSFVSDKLETKNHLDVLRSSMEENLIHRKATFGKVSSFRGSASILDL